MFGRRGRVLSARWSAGLLAVLGIAINVPTGVVINHLPAAMTGHRLVWTLGLVGGALLSVVLTVMRPDDGGEAVVLAGQVPVVAGWVNRAELGQVVSALTGRGSGTAAAITGLVGAGGFGKTTLAAWACRQRAVKWRFRGGVVWVTVGQDTDDATLAAKISDVVQILGGDGGVKDLEQAGQALAGTLARRRGRTLLVADDVWTDGQLAPFVAAGQAGRLLITTRKPHVLDGTGARHIKVDAVPATVARALLARDLPVAIPEGLERELLDLARGMPLLLSLINARLADEIGRDAAIGVAAADTASRLRNCRAALDGSRRERAVAATIGYSLNALAEADRERFCELGIFARDDEIPVAVADDAA